MYESVLHEYSEIGGLKWIRNINIPTGPNSSILLGGLATTAEIRAPGYYTEYSVWGIHLATDDNLTFVSKEGNDPIIISFVDCRAGSPTHHRYLEVVTTPDPRRRLVVPRGVAHLPMNVRGLITINTPQLYWDYKSRFVSLEIDVINVERERPLDKFPTYDVCRFRLPQFFYPPAIANFKARYNPLYQAPFVFDRSGRLAVLRKLAQADNPDFEDLPFELSHATIPSSILERVMANEPTSSPGEQQAYNHS